MTIDEVIEGLKSENGYYANNGMTDVAEFNTKIIRWLEDYKRIKMLIPIEQALKAEYNKGYADGSLSVTSEIRNKVIDDFAEKLKARSIKVSTVKDHTYLKAVGTNKIDKIAQQMKEGVRV